MMYIISGTIYISLSIILMLGFFIWHYFMYAYYAPILLCSLIFLILGITSYKIGRKHHSV